MSRATRTVAALACLMALTLARPSPAADVAKVPARDQFVIVPIRVVVLTSKDLEIADSTLSGADADRAMAEVNRIWAKAGIRFAFDPIALEPAAHVPRFNEHVKMTGGEFANIDPFAYLLPASLWAFEGPRVAIFRELPINGGYILGADAVIVKQAPELRPVAGGSDLPIGRVMARALGQPLGLKARPNDEIGVMSNSTTGVALSEEEVARARDFARTMPGALGVLDATKAAEAAATRSETATARRLWTALAEIPGDGAEAARKKLDALAKNPPKP